MKKKSFPDVLSSFLLLAILGVMPLVVRFVHRPLPPELIPYFPASRFPDGTYLDMFTYFKGLFVLIPAAVIAFVYAADWITNARMPDYKEFFRRPPVMISVAYLAFVIISATFSPYSIFAWFTGANTEGFTFFEYLTTNTAWFGTYARGEGAFMWMAYFVIFFTAMYFVNGTDNAKFLLYGLAFSSIIMGLIGVSQFRFLENILGQEGTIFENIQRDFFNTGLSRWLITVGDPHMAEIIPLERNGEIMMLPRREAISTAFNMAHGTLFNPNTYGKYTAMLSPVLLLAGITYKGKKYVKVSFLAAGILMLLGVAASDSLGGYVGIAVAVGMLALTFLCRPGKTFKIIAASVGASAAVLVIIMMLLAPALQITIFDRLGDAVRSDTSAIPDYIFEGNTITVVNADGEILSMTVHGLGIENWITVRDGSGNVITPDRRIPAPGEQRPLEYRFTVPGYRTVAIEKFSDIFIYQHRGQGAFFLTLENGTIYGISPTLSLIDLSRDIPAWGFYGRETFGSNRGYIWSRSFPLMFTLRGLTIGHGPDTFINEFPKYEMAALQRFFNSPYIIVDKAHNIIIQTWVSTGMFSAIALVALFGHYLFTTFRSLVKSKNEEKFSFGLRLGLLCGITAYFMSSMATDTTIGSTGVFFVLLGIGYGLNYERDLSIAPNAPTRG